MEFKDLIYNRRKQLGLTMEEVANICGVSKATVQRWESGEIANIRRDKITKLAKALHTTPAFLMGWENENNSISLVLSDKEISLINAYRSQPAMQEAVDRLLGLPAANNIDNIVDDAVNTVNAISSAVSRQKCKK